MDRISSIISSYEFNKALNNIFGITISSIDSIPEWLRYYFVISFLKETDSLSLNNDSEVFIRTANQESINNILSKFTVKYKDPISGIETQISSLNNYKLINSNLYNYYVFTLLDFADKSTGKDLQSLLIELFEDNYLVFLSFRNLYSLLFNDSKLNDVIVIRLPEYGTPIYSFKSSVSVDTPTPIQPIYLKYCVPKTSLINPKVLNGINNNEYSLEELVSCTEVDYSTLEDANLWYEINNSVSIDKTNKVLDKIRRKQSKMISNMILSQ